MRSYHNCQHNLKFFQLLEIFFKLYNYQPIKNFHVRPPASALSHHAALVSPPPARQTGKLSLRPFERPPVPFGELPGVRNIPQPCWASEGPLSQSWDIWLSMARLIKPLTLSPWASAWACMVSFFPLATVKFILSYAFEIHVFLDFADVLPPIIITSMHLLCYKMRTCTIMQNAPFYKGILVQYAL